MDVERWLTAELATFGCGACGAAYGDGRIRLIAQREDLFFVDLACDHCGSQAVAIVSIQVDGDTPTLETGELTPADVADDTAASSRDRRRPISVDDVIDAHELLVDFEGDAQELIARFRGERR